MLFSATWERILLFAVEAGDAKTSSVLYFGVLVNANRVPATIAIGVFVAVESDAMERLVNVTDQVEKPGHRDRLLPVVSIGDFVHAPVHAPHGIFLAGWRLMLCGVGATIRKGHRVVVVVPRAVVEFVGVVIADPIGPGSRAHEQPFVLALPCRLLGYENSS